jgi:hypothetical protein
MIGQHVPLVFFPVVERDGEKHREGDPTGDAKSPAPPMWTVGYHHKSSRMSSAMRARDAWNRRLTHAHAAHRANTIRKYAPIRSKAGAAR